MRRTLITAAMVAATLIPATLNAGRIVWPCSGTVSSAYGPRGSGYHHGIDIAVNSNTILGSPGNGTVTAFFWDSCAGNVYKIGYGGGWETRFLHTNSSIRGVGSGVVRNVDVARSGNTGTCTTGPHLHFEVRKDGVSQLVPGSAGNWVSRGNEIPREYAGLNDGPTVGGAIKVRHDQLGGYGGILGPPITNELTTPNGIGKYNHFQNNGSIYWTSATGAWEVYGAIRDKWASMGWETSPLGFPTSGEGAALNGGRFNKFQNGAIYWTSSTGAHEVRGLIYQKWESMNWEHGPLGFPISDEGPAANGGRYSHFQNGSIYWHPNIGAHEVRGAIFAAWEDQGWENGPLGYPTSDEYDVPTGRQSDFENGSITWDASTGAVTINP